MLGEQGSFFGVFVCFDSSRNNEGNLTEVKIGSHVITHIRQDEYILENTEKAVDVWLAIFVVSDVENYQEWNADKVDCQNCLFVSQRLDFFPTLRHEAASRE